MSFPAGREQVVRVGAWCLLLQPSYLLVELLVAAQVTTSYGLITRTISDLGVTSCGLVPYPGAPGPVCSPAHAWLNVSFVLFGLALAAGFPATHSRWPPARLRTTATVLWVVAGLSSVATGLVPVDLAPDVHLLVSTPVFLAQPVALLLSGLGTGDRVAALAAAVSLGAAAVFVTGTIGGVDGLLERLALWPGYLWLGIAGARLLVHLEPTEPRHWLMG